LEKSEKKNLNIFLGGATPFSDNRGIAAILMGTLNILSSTFPNDNLSVTIWNTFPFSGERYAKKVPTTNLRIPANVKLKVIGQTGVDSDDDQIEFFQDAIKLFLLLAMTIIVRILDKVQIHVKSRTDVINYMLSADFVVDLNFGDVFTDTYYGKKKWFFNTMRLLTIVFSGKPVYLFPQAIGPFKSKINKALARLILNRTRIIAVRDKYSLEHVKNLGVKQKVLLVPDTGFRSSIVNAETALNILKAEGLNLAKKTTLIGLIVSPKYFSLASDKSVKLLDQFVSIIDGVISDLDASIVFIPHDLSLNHSYFDCKQLSILIRSKLKNKNQTIVLSQDYTVEEFWGIISVSDLTISMMTHPVIASTKVGVPVIAISYSHKTPGVLKFFGLEKFAFSLSDFMNISNKSDFINQVLNNRDDIRCRLINGLSSINAIIDEFQDELSQDVTDYLLFDSHEK
jgi:colanic acid/amylovoran biosynthesis protein